MSDRTETLKHLAKSGPVWDGNLISKTDRDELVKAGWVDRFGGWNFLTNRGVEAAVALGILKP
jgi:hypothetical protein